MSKIQVEPVQTRRQQKQFFQLPWQLYRDDPLWVPPLRKNQLELLGYKPHPFHDVADVQTFVAERGGEVCGRIATIIHHDHIKRYDEQRAFFGFFESVNDEEVAGRLFDTAFQWLRERGMESIRGPMSPAFHYEIGMLIDGFQYPPSFMIPYNPAYYPELLDRYGGFEKAQDLYTFYGHLSEVPKLLETINFVVAQAKQRFDIKLRAIDKRRFTEEIELFLRIYNQSFQSHWGFVPMSEAEMIQISAEMKHLILPDYTVYAEVDGKTIGVLFALPDYNPRIRKIDGRLFPFGFARLLWNRHGINRARVISTNVVPEFQMWGLAAVMLEYLIPIAQRNGLEHVEFSWVAESNKLSRLTLENGGGAREKTHRIFDRDIV